MTTPLRIRIVPPHSLHRRGRRDRERGWMIITLAKAPSGGWAMAGYPIEALTLAGAVSRFRFVMRRRPAEWWLW